jgi:hypothetical protein
VDRDIRLLGGIRAAQEAADDDCLPGFCPAVERERRTRLHLSDQSSRSFDRERNPRHAPPEWVEKESSRSG